MPTVLIVGAGLTGCTLAHRLAREGVKSVLLERAEVPGGLIRSEHMEGVLYEPHGSHIFHTEDEEVWKLANSMTPFRPYRHRVDIVVEGKVLNWPILLSDIEAQSRSEEIQARARGAPGRRRRGARAGGQLRGVVPGADGPDPLRALHQALHREAVGQAGARAVGEWAPRRVQVRWDNDPYLFPDPYQGWPAGPNGYTDLIDGLLDDQLIELRTGVDVTLENLEEHAARWTPTRWSSPVPLDVFAGERFGALDWRGIIVRSFHVPHVEYAQGAMVVNYPGFEYPFIRIHETKHASGQKCEGTVLGFEFTERADALLPDRDCRRTGRSTRRYQNFLRSEIGAERTYFAGRLANYLYIDMDDCMRQALDAAEDVLAAASVRL